MTETDQSDVFLEGNQAEVIIRWKPKLGFLGSDPDIILMESSTYEFFGLERKSVLALLDLFVVPCGCQDEVFTDDQAHADSLSLNSA